MKKLIIIAIFSIGLLVSCQKEIDTKLQNVGVLKDMPTEGLIDLFEFSGNADNGVNPLNHGTLHGGVTLCNDRFNNPGMAYQFDGVEGSYISTVFGGPLGNSPRTVSFWVKTNSFDMQYLVSYGSIDVAASFGTALNNPCIGIGFDGGAGVSMRGDSTLLDGTWHQLVIVWEGPPNDIHVEDGTFYIDGYQDDSTTCSASGSTFFTQIGLPYTFGADLNPHGRVLNGCLDDIRIYDRALSGEEILTLFRAPNPRWDTQSMPNAHRMD